MDIDTKIKQLDQGVRAVSAVFLLIVGYFGVRLSLQIPHFATIFKEMLAGEPLPLVTQFLISNSSVVLISSFLIPLVGLVAVFMIRSPRPALFTIAGCMAITFIQSHIIFSGLITPLMDIVGKVSGVR